MPQNYDPLKSALGRFIDILRKPLPAERVEHNAPLIELAKLEKPFRNCFLYHEDFSAIVNDLLLGYSTRHPYILTKEAEKVVETLRSQGDSRIYVAELVVPKTGDMGIHVTDIDLVSFRGNGLEETLDFLTEHIISPLNFSKFTKPAHKGDIKHGYYSSHSLTQENFPGKVEITDIKVRKLAHEVD